MSTPFWINQPSILFNKKYLTHLIPSDDMTLEEKFNAITKVVIILAGLGFIFTQNMQLVIISILTIAIISVIYYRKKKQYIEERTQKDGFDNNRDKNNDNLNNDNDGNNNLNNTVSVDDVIELKKLMNEGYHKINKKNPFGNVLLTDIASNPDRPSAPPSFNPEVGDKIISSIKKQTQMLNPTIDGTNKQIYGDLYENYNLDNSTSRFYSTANTRVANDQGAYAQWLYGNMPSAKEDNIEGNIQRVKDNYRHILI